MTRRQFLGAGAALAAAGAAPRGEGASRAGAEPPLTPQGLPLVDLHAHPDRSTVDAIVALAAERGVKLGLVEHAGTRENVYPRILSNDAELRAWVGELEGRGVYKGVQAEWTDWSSCFSKPALAQLDYVLGDAMTFPGPGGQRMKLWEKEAVIDTNAERFMDRFVDWHVQLLHEQPIDLLANASWLPAVHAGRYETLWTERRVARVVAALVARGVALEISSSYQLPKERFLRQAREAGVKFTFGSNGRYPNMARLDYSLEMAGRLGLRRADCWLPDGRGPRAAR